MGKGVGRGGRQTARADTTTPPHTSVAAAVPRASPPLYLRFAMRFSLCSRYHLSFLFDFFLCLPPVLKPEMLTHLSLFVCLSSSLCLPLDVAGDHAQRTHRSAPENLIYVSRYARLLLVVLLLSPNGSSLVSIFSFPPFSFLSGAVCFYLFSTLGSFQWLAGRMSPCVFFSLFSS